MKFPLSPRVELEFFRQLWQKSNDPFWLCACTAEDFVLAAVNPAEEALGEMLRPGASLRAIMGDGEAGDRLLSGYFACRDSAQTVKFSQQLVFQGQERLFETLLVPVTNAQGEVTHICGTARDLTAFLVAQRSLEELNRQLELRVADRTRALDQANAELREANRVLEKLAASDSLTELANRRVFFERAAAEVLRAHRYGHPLALQMLDLDHFKSINDHFGHAAGDEVLRQLAGVVRANLRHNDLAARIGGEEFVVLLPETRLTDAAQHAERLRAAIAALRIPFAQSMISVTVSIGVAALDSGELSPEPMLMRADSALYGAKQDGRNRLQVAWGDEVGGSLWLL
ncbi:MAG: diguanylate cyclase [Propionivibrio sp.]